MIRVLVAEDHTIVREGIKQLIGLAKDLCVVGEASNGEQLLDTLRQTPCEVVLLDISMPGVNGLEAIPRIRALANPPAILVLSMHDEAQMAARALKIGAAGYATKDSDPAVSSKTISTHKARLMQKLGANSVADLVRYALEHKL
ncbi:Chemotaxis response regulator protein-glutamate methylesterase [compost metagenome]